MTRRLVSALILLSLGMGSMFAEDTPKKVYMSFILHGNMNYDRYVRTTIWEQFPVIYDNLLDFNLKDGPTVHIQLEDGSWHFLDPADGHMLD